MGVPMDLQEVEPGSTDQATKFWSGVDRSAGPDACWPPLVMDEWLFQRGRHRLAWAYTHGPIPSGLHLLHDPVLCNHTWCCNTRHMRLGTHAENMRDKAAARACDLSLRTHCDCGRAYHAGRRECDACLKEESVRLDLIRQRK